MPIGICKLCRVDKQLIKAHIVPRSFWSGSTKPLAIFSDDQELQPQKSLIGIYDENILCETCDNELGRLDEYALLNLVRASSVKKVFRHSGIMFEYSNLNAYKIYCFIMSVAWRASVSNNKYYGEICLGPYEAEFRNEFMQAPMGSINFEVYISEFDTSVLPYLQPKSVRVDNINMIVVYANRFKILIKTDKRKFATPPKPVNLQCGNSIYSTIENWATSLERKTADRILHSNPRPKFW
jgi:hypothetical protein